MGDVEAAMAVVLSRLDYIEKRRAEDRQHFDAVVGELKEEVRSSIARIAYVSMDRFGDYKASAAERDRETREIATDARALARAALWVLIVAVVSGVSAVAFRVAGS